MYLSFISFYLLLLLLLFASHLTKKKADSCGLFFFAIVLNRSNGLKCSFYYFSTRRHWKKYLVALSRFTEAFFIRKYIVGNINLVYRVLAFLSLEKCSQNNFCAQNRIIVMESKTALRQSVDKPIFGQKLVLFIGFVALLSHLFLFWTLDYI